MVCYTAQTCFITFQNATYCCSLIYSYALRRNHLLKLKEASIKWALKSIEKSFDTYIFPMPFEYEAIKLFEQDVIDYLKNIDVLSEGMRDYRSSLTPKSIMGFRIATQLDPLDSIISQAIIYEISDDIERARLPKGNEVVYSFRLKPESDGKLYDPDYNWSKFFEKADKILKEDPYSHILVTDISDFFPSIYLHYIETVLKEAVASSGKVAHAQVLINYIKAMHLNQTHKGVPVGPQFSRPIAELILDVVDKILLAKGIKFIRYVDDYIIFSKSEIDARINLAFIAQELYDKRHLKLNEKKTKILTEKEFKETHLTKPDEIAESAILVKFQELLEELDIDQDPYEEIAPEDLSEEDWEKLRSINLEQILEEELSKQEPSSFLISFLLANLARIDNTSVADTILQKENIVKLFPKLRTIINYLERVRSFSVGQKQNLGEKILDLIASSFVGTLEFNRMWLLNLFTKTSEWDNENQFVNLYTNYSDDLTRREIFLALGRSKNIEFYRSNKSINLDINSWIRRAFIAGISCLPKDEREPWFKSRGLRNRDFMDKIVEKWALKNHF